MSGGVISETEIESTEMFDTRRQENAGHSLRRQWSLPILGIEVNSEACQKEFAVH